MKSSKKNVNGRAGTAGSTTRKRPSGEQMWLNLLTTFWSAHQKTWNYSNCLRSWSSGYATSELKFGRSDIRPDYDGFLKSMPRWPSSRSFTRSRKRAPLKRKSWKKR